MIESWLTDSAIAPTPRLERVLPTVLFTDLVDSTVVAARVGDSAWATTLDRHDSISRRAVERFRGTFVKSTGDGVLATFDGPARAIDCARAIAANLQGLGLQVRAGLHTGEIERRGADIGGIAVNLAARVMDLAGSDEIWVTGTVPSLVVGSEHTFTPRGEHQLKGIPGTWALASVD